jgi:hypothetical protein
MPGTISASSKEGIHTIVHWVKCMRDIGCVSFIRDEDAYVLEQWI